jgi:hypothetical protein
MLQFILQGTGSEMQMTVNILPVNCGTGIGTGTCLSKHFVSSWI